MLGAILIPTFGTATAEWPADLVPAAAAALTTADARDLAATYQGGGTGPATAAEWGRYFALLYRQAAKFVATLYPEILAGKRMVYAANGAPVDNLAFDAGAQTLLSDLYGLYNSYASPPPGLAPPGNVQAVADFRRAVAEAGAIGLVLTPFSGGKWWIALVALGALAALGGGVALVAHARRARRVGFRGYTEQGRSDMAGRYFVWEARVGRFTTPRGERMLTSATAAARGCADRSRGRCDVLTALPLNRVPDERL